MRSAGGTNYQTTHKDWRLAIIGLVVFLFGCLIIGRLSWLQVIRGQYYLARATGQQMTEQRLYPTRGSIYLKVKSADNQDLLYPLASNQELYLLFADPPGISDKAGTIRKIIETLGPVLPEGKTSQDYTAKQLTELREQEILTLADKVNSSRSHYEPLRKRLTKQEREKIKALQLPGVNFVAEDFRYYPATEGSGQLLGFVGFKDNLRRGFYGLEGYWEKELAGQMGIIKSEKDALGRLISIGDLSVQNSQDGTSLVLTLDQTIQRYVCQRLAEAVKKHQASGGTVIVQNPKTGAILALCNYPDFNPANYGQVKDISIFNNSAIFFEYEPGSVFKAMTMAAAINEGGVTPETTYNDNAPLTINREVIQNSDFLNHGIQTMTQVLEKSLNTGAIFAMRSIGSKIFAEYVKNFGFGQVGGIEMNSEVPGNISSLKQKGEIYYATASFGQGLTVTPLQIVTAYSALANGGVLMKPYIVQELIDAQGKTTYFQPQVKREVVSSRTARLVTSMLVSVVQNGHGKLAGVPGYLVAGKTGTAQIPLKNARGYEANAHIGNFVGFAPADNPKFAMVVKIDRPKDVAFAESSAAPLFGEIAKFILNYYQINPSQK